jgi:hypothetical protein
LSLLRLRFRENATFLRAAENITVSFSASPAPDKVKSKTQMNSYESKIQKSRSSPLSPVFSSFLRQGEIKHPHPDILSGQVQTCPAETHRAGIVVYSYPTESN